MSTPEPSPRPTVFLETYGCQMNELDSELVKNELEALGYRFVPTPEQAGVVLLNTCSVRDLSEQKVRSQLGRLNLLRKESRPELVIGVLGCMAERDGKDLLKRNSIVDVLCGPSHLDALPTLVDNAVRNRRAGQRATEVALAGHTSRRSAVLDAAEDRLEGLDLARSFSPVDRDGQRVFQAYVRITRGCNKFCSFCVVPFTRGPEVHRPPQNIVDEVKKLADAGILEVTLIGQTVNHYESVDGGTRVSFADLLRRVHDAVPHLPRLRFVTSYPRDFTDDALDAMAECKRICRYLHLPAQSGSNRLLGLMNRGHDIESYLALLERARARMPDLRLAGDMIVGFPTETDEDHRASIALLRTARYKNSFIFKYSPRPGTVAERRLADDVPDDVKRQRNLELLEVQNEICKAHNEALVGQTFSVLVEGANKPRAGETPPPASEGGTAVRVGWLERRAPDSSEPAAANTARLVGRTEGDEIVAFVGPPSLVGHLVNVRVDRCTTLTLQGELVETLRAPGHADDAAALSNSATFG